MLVRDYMTPDPKTLKVTNTIKDAAFLFYKYKINGAPVVTEENKVCGLVTKSNIIQAVINEIPFSEPITTVMTNNVITVNQENTIEEAWQIPVGRLPVVTRENEVVGMLTRHDFLAAFYNQMRRANDEMLALVRSAHNGIIVINTYGMITTFNKAAAELTGVPTKEAIGKFIQDVVPHTGLTRVLLTGKSETGCQIVVNNQTLVSNRSPICEGPKIVGALAIIQNTSELEHIIKRLEETERQTETLENIFENSKHGILVVDIKGTVIKVNKSYEEIYGVAREEILGRCVKDAIENTRLYTVLTSGVPEFGEVQDYRGMQVIVNRVPIFQDGVLVGALEEAMFRDVRELHSILEKLNINFNQLKSVEENSPDSSRRSHYTFDDIIGRSRSMIQAKNLAAKAALTDTNVLIIGESGTGKELFAHAIHGASYRRDKPFVAVNCAAIPSELLEAELFGYEEGAFTGAKKGGKQGKFELAEGGTLFLDEIGDMPLPMQAKLLRVIQDKTLERVGGTKVESCDVRIIAATNKTLEKLVTAHQFREDLYYRLNVIRVDVPPLRERREDIGELVHILANKVCKKLGVSVKKFTPEALSLVREYHWPGNVRELINLLEQLMATVNGSVIAPRHFPQLKFTKYDQYSNVTPIREELQQGEGKWEMDRILETLRITKGNKSLAAKILGMHRSTLYEKIKKYNIQA